MSNGRGRRARRGDGPEQGGDMLAELDDVQADSARFGLVLADTGQGAGAVFRRGPISAGWCGPWAARATRKEGRGRRRAAGGAGQPGRLASDGQSSAARAMLAE